MTPSDTSAGYEEAMALARRMAYERDERFEQLKASEAEADRYRVALRYLADRDNWLGDPLGQTSTLHGHFTPYEMALRALSGKGEQDDA
jgi:hypothetical protein